MPAEVGHNLARPRPRWVGFVAAALIQVALTAFLKFLHPYFPLGSYPAPYATALLVTLLVYGEGPTILGFMLSVFFFLYFFVFPRGTITTPENVSDLAMITAYVLVTSSVVVAVGLLRRGREQSEHYAEGLRRAQSEREITIELLGLVNESKSTKDLIQAAISFFQQQSGCEAVGIRLSDGDNYPYYETKGFSDEFTLAENDLCARDDGGFLIRDSESRPILECMCGSVINGNINPTKPFFTEQGSFWTNSLTELLPIPTGADRKEHIRNRCGAEGYESVALIPLHVGDNRVGLLQLNDKQRDRFSADLIGIWERLAHYLAVALARLRAEEELRGLDAHKRQFYRQTILAATEGKLLISERVEIVEMAGTALDEWHIDSLDDVARIRTATTKLAREAGMDEERIYDFIGCVVESTANAAKHANGGIASLHKRDHNLLFVVSDSGHGIGALSLPDVALTRGYTTAGTLGMGYKVMIRFADKVYLATGPDGTIVASEMKLHIDPSDRDGALSRLIDPRFLNKSAGRE